MSGGNDGLNTVIPYTDLGYAKARPTIGLPERDVVKLSSSVALHPNMSALKPLYDKGQVAVLTGVGYPSPNRSHFQSMDIWQTGNPTVDVRERTGWLARYFDDDGHFNAELLGGDQVTGNPVDGRLVHAERMRAGKIFARELDHHPTIDRLSHC